MHNDAWVDRSVYPFQPRFLDVDGGRMHYVDEGAGAPIVMVHGTPTWSFLYRHLITELSRSHRVIAPDHIGFGLSEKPQRWGLPARGSREESRHLDRAAGADRRHPRRARLRRPDRVVVRDRAPGERPCARAVQHLDVVPEGDTGLSG